MLLPAFGDARLTGKQGAEILKRSPLGRHYEQRRCNGGRCGSLPPPTPKRNCYPFAQRHTATPCDRPAAGWRQCDRFFYGPINLAKALTRPGGMPALSANSRCDSARSAGFRSNRWETKINYIAIAPAQYCRWYFYGPACSLPFCHRPLWVRSR
jgi:hypothetical protein